MEVQSIRLTAIDDQYLVYLPPNKAWEKVPLTDCIALLNPQAKQPTTKMGMLMLADGQRFPGSVAESQPSEAKGETVPWQHAELGKLDVPLDLIETIILTPNVTPPPPGIDGDVVLLANGDRQEGLIVSFGDPLSLELTSGNRGEIIDIPLNLVAAVTMVAKKQPPGGKRIWFADSTVIDVQSIAVGDDGYVRLSGPWLSSGASQPTRRQLAEIAAILLDPNGMIPLAMLQPSRIEGPATRYELPRPQLIEPNAPLNLSAIELHGPIVVRYALPAGCQRFTADAELPREARAWGDLELVIRLDDAEALRVKLNGTNSSASINVPVTGRELTIELLPGANGPIQDHVVLRRPMLLKAR